MSSYYLVDMITSIKLKISLIKQNHVLLKLKMWFVNLYGDQKILKAVRPLDWKQVFHAGLKVKSFQVYTTFFFGRMKSPQILLQQRF